MITKRGETTNPFSWNCKDHRHGKHDETRRRSQVRSASTDRRGSGTAAQHGRTGGQNHGEPRVKDLHAADGDWPVKPKLPFIPGHEGVGVVAAIGSGAKRFKEGDAVGVPWLHDACGGCEYCITGRETLCRRQHNTGYVANGGYA
jgi:hypothetical protein